MMGYAADRRRKPLAIIVAIGKDRAIGKNGDMIWHISADLKRFRKITMGHAVIMGRKTWESLPGGALPGRRNIVVTRDRSFSAEGAETAGSPEEAINLCSDDNMPFIIGGAEIYRQTLPMATRLYLTEIYGECAEADARFPEISGDEWRVVRESEEEVTPKGLRYRFTDFERK